MPPTLVKGLYYKCQLARYGFLGKTRDHHSECPKAHPKEREAPSAAAWRSKVLLSPLNSSFGLLSLRLAGTWMAKLWVQNHRGSFPCHPLEGSIPPYDRLNATESGPALTSLSCRRHPQTSSCFHTFPRYFSPITPSCRASISQSGCLQYQRCHSAAQQYLSSTPCLLIV